MTVGDDLRNPVMDSNHHQLAFHGSYGRLLWLSFKTFFLSAITLGVYLFWGLTSIRTELWRSVTLDGDPFEYRGTGKELFKGFIRSLILVAIPLYLLSELGQGGVIIAALVTIFLLGTAYFLLLRYRLQRTVWRGFNGGVTGHSFRFGLFGLVAYVGSFLSLGLLAAFFIDKAVSWMARDSHFGNSHFKYNSNWKSPLFIAYGVLKAVAAFAISVYLPYNVYLASLADSLPVFSVFDTFGWFLVWVIFSSYLNAKIAIQILTNLSFGAASLSFHGSDLKLARLWLTNMLLIILTLGLAFPVTKARKIRFFCRYFQIKGVLPLEEMQKITGEKKTEGEDLSHEFGLGAI